MRPSIFLLVLVSACGGKVAVDATESGQHTCAEVMPLIAAACPSKGGKDDAATCARIDDAAVQGICTDPYHTWMDCLAADPSSPCMSGSCVSAEQAYSKCAEAYCTAHPDDTHCL